MATLDKLGGVYRLAAEGCAEAISRTPWVEPTFVRLSRHFWHKPTAGRFLRSVAYRLAARLFERGDGIRTIPLGGVPLRLNVGEWTTMGGYFADLPYEPATVAYLSAHLVPGDVFVDIGANSGYFTLLGASLVGDRGRVVAFEPNPAVRQRLSDNVARNQFERRVTIESCALTDHCADRIQLFVPSHDGFATLVPERTHAQEQVAGATAVAVRARTFDDWMASTTPVRIALMKIDVEGAETQVLSGMSSALASGQIARVILETAWDSTAHRLLVNQGYTPERIESVGGPVDNIAYTR